MYVDLYVCNIIIIIIIIIIEFSSFGWAHYDLNYSSSFCLKLGKVRTVLIVINGM